MSEIPLDADGAIESVDARPDRGTDTDTLPDFDFDAAGVDTADTEVLSVAHGPEDGDLGAMEDLEPDPVTSELTADQARDIFGEDDSDGPGGELEGGDDDQASDAHDRVAAARARVDAAYPGEPAPELANDAGGPMEPGDPLPPTGGSRDGGNEDDDSDGDEGDGTDPAGEETALPPLRYNEFDELAEDDLSDEIRAHDDNGLDPDFAHAPFDAPETDGRLSPGGRLAQPIVVLDGDAVLEAAQGLFNSWQDEVLLDPDGEPFFDVPTGDRGYPDELVRYTDELAQAGPDGEEAALAVLAHFDAFGDLDRAINPGGHNGGGDDGPEDPGTERDAQDQLW